MRNENFIIHSWQARVAPRKKKQSGYGIFYVSDFEILCSRLDKSRMLTFMNRRIRTRMFGGVGGVVLKPPYPNLFSVNENSGKTFFIYFQSTGQKIDIGRFF